MPGASLTLNNLTVTLGRTSIESGAGIFNNGTLSLTNCTVSGNSVGTGGAGGGIFNNGTVDLTNSTVSGNSANLGGGINNNGTVNLTNSTISGNFAGGVGSGIRNNGTLRARNTIISGNRAAQFNLDGSIQFNENNIIGNEGAVRLAP